MLFEEDVFNYYKMIHFEGKKYCFFYKVFILAEIIGINENKEDLKVLCDWNNNGMDYSDRHIRMFVLDHQIIIAILGRPNGILLKYDIIKGKKKGDYSFYRDGWFIDAIKKNKCIMVIYGDLKRYICISNEGDVVCEIDNCNQYIRELIERKKIGINRYKVIDKADENSDIRVGVIGSDQNMYYFSIDIDKTTVKELSSNQEANRTIEKKPYSLKLFLSYIEYM